MKEPAAEPEDICFRVPRIHWIGDLIAAFFLSLSGAGSALLVMCGIAFGALNWPVWNLAWMAAVSVLVGVALMIHFARARLGRCVRLTAAGIQRGMNPSYAVIPYESVRLITIERHGQSQCSLKVKRGFGSVVFFLSQADVIECFHALRQLCPQAGAIDEQGTNLPPVAADPPSRALKAMSREWRGRAMKGLLLAIVGPLLFCPFMLIVLMYYFPQTPMAAHVVRTGLIGVIAMLGGLMLAIRAMRQARRLSADAKASSRDSVFELPNRDRGR